MNYREIMTGDDSQRAVELFNACVEAGEVLYKPFEDAKGFEAFFLRRFAEGTAAVNLLSDDGNAFASGCYVETTGKCYITFVAVNLHRRRQGLGRAILNELEGRLNALAHGRAACELIFSNPMNLPWILPGTGGHDHPNAPGVDVSSGAYLFFKNCGYRDYAYQNSYHMELTDYVVPGDIPQRICALKEKGMEVAFYDSAVHTGLEELLESLGNAAWTREILGNAVLPGGGNPLLIVNRGGRAMGFTGPLSVQESGRGYFSGIAVHSDCRGSGAGKVLFSCLCAELRDMGARFMTLFTGETNPARNIYEAAGFDIVRTWADMKKEMHSGLP